MNEICKTNITRNISNQTQTNKVSVECASSHSLIQTRRVKQTHKQKKQEEVNNLTTLGEQMHHQTQTRQTNKQVRQDAINKQTNKQTGCGKQGNKQSKDEISKETNETRQKTGQRGKLKKQNATNKQTSK